MSESYKIARTIIEEGEDDRLKAYKDTVGKWTIGRGRNLEDRGISQPESDLMFANDLEEGFAVCRSEFGFFKTLSAVRQAVIVDLCHNMGLGALMGFTNMLKAMQIGDFDKAAEEVRFTKTKHPKTGEPIIRNTKYWDDVGDRAKRNYCMIKFDKIYTKQEAESYFMNQ